MIKTYALVAKPGIILGNLITTTAGFALASLGYFDFLLFLEMFIGLGAVIGSACVFNNYVDRDADAKMSRTKERPLVQGLISGKHALVFASVLALFGFAMLVYFTNWLAVGIAIAGFFIYVVLYSFWKYHTNLATLVGSVAGATPPVVGYVTASNTLDLGAWLLFLLLVLWQMPHFFSIAIYRLEDYKAAHIPVLPAEAGILATQKQMLYYIIAFFVPVALLFFFGYAGVVYFAVAMLTSVFWLVLSVRGFKTRDIHAWARDMFRVSLILITAISLTLIFNI